MDTLYAFICFLKLFQYKLEDYRSKPTLIHISSRNINTYRRNPSGNNINQIARKANAGFATKEDVRELKFLMRTIEAKMTELVKQ